MVKVVAGEERADLRGEGARRIRRDPELGPLGPIRSLAYFVPVVEEVQSEDWPEGYMGYLEAIVNRTRPSPVPPC